MASRIIDIINRIFAFGRNCVERASAVKAPEAASSKNRGASLSIRCCMHSSGRGHARSRLGHQKSRHFQCLIIMIK